MPTSCIERRRLLRGREHGFTPLWRPAEHGFTPLWRPAEHGFTLVELIVVMTIIGLMAAAVALSIPEGDGGLRAEAETFAARAKAAQESAFVDARSTSLRVDSSGYAIARSDGGAWRETARFAWEEGTQPDFGTGTSGRSLFDPTGLAEPLEVNLRRGGEQVQITIRSDGEIQVRR